ncbi:hypothetical protein N665_0156s0012 [Sinapis alba]|nr:hypothetical protein N665_0156s0012 [Sinapis alba]
MSPIRRCSLKGKSIATVSDSRDSESLDSPLVGRPRVIMLKGMEDPRPPTGDDLAELNDDERSVIHFSMELENRETSAHASLEEMERETENISAPVTKSVEDADLVNKENTPSEKETYFRLVDLLPMRWTGTNFEFAEEIDPEKERRFSSVRKLIFQIDPPAGFTFLIPASHQRLWTPPVGYACVYESWFIKCRIALGQYITNGIKIMVTLTVLASELGIKMSVRLFEEITTPSITAKTGFFYGKMVTKYNVITRKPSKVNFWNRSYFCVKNNEASFEDPLVIMNGYFNANIGCSDSFQEQVEAIRTLSHHHWPDISEARIQAALNRIVGAETAVETPSSKIRKKKISNLNLASLPFYAASIGTPSHGQEESSGGSRPAKRRRTSHPDEGASNVNPRPSPSPGLPAREHLGDEVGNQEPSSARNSPLKPVDETEMVMTTGEPQGKRLRDLSLEGELPEEELQGDELQRFDHASQGDEVVEYPHVVDFCYQHTEVPFVGDHEEPTRLFHQIKLKKKQISELNELPQRGRNQEMTRAGAIFFGSANLIVRDYEAKIKTQGEKQFEKSRSLKKKKKKKENGELKGKSGVYEDQVGQLVAEKDQAMETAEIEKSRGELLSKELEELKDQKEVLDSCLRRLEQEKIEAASKFETTTKRLKESREHERRGGREGLEKIQALGMSMDEVLEQVRDDENRYSDELNEMEVIEASEINLQPISLDEHGSNLTVFSLQDIEDLRHFD